MHNVSLFCAACSGSYLKREGRPRDDDVLVARLVDRPLRPMLEKGWCNETQVGHCCAMQLLSMLVSTSDGCWNWLRHCRRPMLQKGWCKESQMRLRCAADAYGLSDCCLMFVASSSLCCAGLRSKRPACLNNNSPYHRLSICICPRSWSG